jgi:D-alanyl-D-alanine carboxypeptidase/D-alanyl-D-alanine-endopeptidase (penicillin-binding protein 4)
MNAKLAFRTILSVAFSATVALCPGPAPAQSDLPQRIQNIMARPEFAHARFGIEFIVADTGDVLYQLYPQELFVPGSTTKLLTEGTALNLLGPDYRFHTAIYRTGPIQKNGVLKGDLVLVASGDPDLSNRIEPDGTLAFENEDHSYGGPDSQGLPGDPLLVIHEFAQQIAAKGIKRVEGRLLIDNTLFPEGERELGTGVAISPVVVNDSLIDVVVSPGATEDAPVQWKIAPQTSYITFVNHAKTGKPGSKTTLGYEEERLNPDGSRSVTLTGTLALDAKPTMVSYAVPEPSRYAATLLMEALREQGVRCTLAAPAESIDFKALATNDTADKLVAEHVSPPFREEVKVTLKVSQNLHASTTPYLLGALVAHKDTQIKQAGFDQERAFLTKAGLDLTGAAQSDGAGGDAFFSPDFVIHFLRYMSTQKDYDLFYRSLPILGKDGTLAKIQVDSHAAGHVHAKTGTFSVYDALNKRLTVTGKGLAGYMDTASGQHLILALYVNMVSVSLDDPEATQKVAGEALGAIAAAAYDAPPTAAPTSAQ